MFAFLHAARNNLSILQFLMSAVSAILHVLNVVHLQSHANLVPQVTISILYLLSA